MPKGTERKLWEKRNRFFIYYKVEQALGDGVDVTSAMLRLWQKTPNSLDTISADPDPVHPWFGASETENEADVRPLYKTTIYSIMKPLKRANRGTPF